jgi:LEA14-like dessication related protein
MASSDHIKPGEKGKITAKINIEGRTGFLSKSIRVFSNDPRNPTVVLSLKATIEKPAD